MMPQNPGPARDLSRVSPARPHRPGRGKRPDPVRGPPAGTPADRHVRAPESRPRRGANRVADTRVTMATTCSGTGAM